MSGLSVAADVRFDFEGSLRLARRLYALGQEIDELMSNRVTWSATALQDWLGPFGVEFSGRIDSEKTQASAIALQLREGARQWAVRWAEAMNEQNSILLAREIKHIEDNRSGWDNFTGGLFGHNDLPPNPPTIDVPSEPNFFATGSLTRY
jgi:hypothetical protein